MITQNLPTLEINKLTKQQYERELAAGRIKDTALYLTPDVEYTAANNDLYKITVDDLGNVSNAIKVTKDDITALGIPAQDTTYTTATKSAAGLMSATDKKKLDKILFNTSESTGAEIFNSATNVASGINAHAEGEDTIAAGKDSHAENYLTRAYGDFSHAEGWRTVALGAKSHAEGSSPCPFDDNEYSHQLTKGTNPADYTAQEIFDIWKARPANKKFTMAIGNWSHAETQGNLSVGTRSHAEGWNTAACSVGAHTEGIGTISAWSTAVDPWDKAVNAQHVEGSYNQVMPEKFLHIVGNGGSEDTRSNAHTLDKNGNAWFAGSIYLGGNYDTYDGKYTGAKTVATDKDISDVYDDIRYQYCNGICGGLGIEWGTEDPNDPFPNPPDGMIYFKIID